MSQPIATNQLIVFLQLLVCLGFNFVLRVEVWLETVSNSEEEASSAGCCVCQLDPKTKMDGKH